MSTRSLLAVVSAGLALLAATTTNHAAEVAYPTKPIRLIVPFPPGGSADPLARAFGTWFADKFGVPVVADNRPGAGTAIAHTLGAKATPDGYTLLLGASSGLTTNPAFASKLDYDSVKDFSPVGLAAYVPQLIVVHPAVPAKSMNELIDLAKAQPGKINFGTPGVGSVGHLSVEWINTATGAKFTHVPYKGAGPGVIDLVGGRIQVFVGSVTGTQPQIAAGRIRALATGHPKRLRNMPELPAIAESVPGFSNDGWYGIVAPAGTPAPHHSQAQRGDEKSVGESRVQQAHRISRHGTDGRQHAGGAARMDPQRACAPEESGARCGHADAGELRAFTLRQTQGERKACGFAPSRE